MGREANVVARLLAGLLDGAVAVLMGVMVLIVLWGVVSRFLLNAPSQWTNEVSEVLLVWLTFLAAAAGFRRWDHLGLDWMAEKLDPDARRWLEVAVSVVCAVFAAAALVWGGYVLVNDTLDKGQLLTTVPVRRGWVYLAAPIGGLLIWWFSLVRAVRIATGTEPVTTEHETQA